MISKFGVCNTSLEQSSADMLESQKIKYPNNLSLWKQENTGPKQDSKNHLRLFVPVGHEPFGFIDGSVLITTDKN